MCHNCRTKPTAAEALTQAHQRTRLTIAGLHHVAQDMRATGDHAAAARLDHVAGRLAKAIRSPTRETT
jgi:hypothetical protein